MRMWNPVEKRSGPRLRRGVEARPIRRGGRQGRSITSATDSSRRRRGPDTARWWRGRRLLNCLGDRQLAVLRRKRKDQAIQPVGSTGPEEARAFVAVNDRLKSQAARPTSAIRLATGTTL